ncbi:MAG: succinate dehydrogenase cytochrome b subunit [Bryobacter sp.]|nr:succinate dehydrogenase cytochrome b subunit [Bryobacter sp.]
MSANAVAIPSPLARTYRFWQATVGKKIIMAVTGLMLFGFVCVHMVGNLQIYIPDGGKSLDHYGELLKSKASILWGARFFLLAVVGLHILTAAQLYLLKREARPAGYVKWKAKTSSYASRTMYLSGPILLGFIIYHLLHLTVGSAHPQFEEGKVYVNVVLGFRQVPAALAYMVAMGALGFHMVHGIWSLFQSLGVNHPKRTPLLRNFATVMTAIIVIGNISIPLSVLLGIVGKEIK